MILKIKDNNSENLKIKESKSNYDFFQIKENESEVIKTNLITKDFVFSLDFSNPKNSQYLILLKR